MTSQLTKIMSDRLGIDFIKVVLNVTWWYAWMGLQVTKGFGMIFKLILSMPDKLLILPNLLSLYNNPILNTQGQKVNILNAYNEAGVITNKMKLFLQWYWTNADNEIYDSNGFNFNEFSKVLNCSVLYCSYLLTDTDGEMSPEDFWKNVRQFVIIQDPKTNNKQQPKVFRSDTTSLSKNNIKSLLAGHVNFDMSEELNNYMPVIPNSSLNTDSNHSFVRNIVSKIEKINA